MEIAFGQDLGHQIVGPNGGLVHFGRPGLPGPDGDGDRRDVPEGANFLLDI